MQVFSPRFRYLWEEWELRGAVFLSLTLQILLICMGNRRKYIHFAWFRGLVWLAYLMADPVAIYALVIITNKLMKMNSQSVDANSQLSAFWSPVLLLHLGGPDTITAYALEDNQLWLRHSLQLVTQAGVTFYIFLMTWTSPNVSILTIVIILSGLVKHGERVYVLWAASSEQFRNSIPDLSSYYCKIMEQYKLMAAEGYAVVPHEVIEVRDVQNSMDGADLSSPEDQFDPEQLCKRKQGESLAARGLVNLFQRLFGDLLLGFEDSRTSQSVLKDKNFLAAFKIIEIELGIMYDLLYTKAMAIYTSRGFACRIIGLFSTCTVLVLFIFIDDQQYPRADLCMSFILLAVAIFLEIYALAVLLFSDRTACWLIKEKKFTILDLINRLQPLTKRRRWSDHMGQFCLLSFAFKEKHLACHRLLEFLQIDEKVEKPLYKHHKKVSDDIKRLIMNHITEMQSPRTTKRSWDLDKSEHTKHLQWTMELEFDQIILVWHIATELIFGLQDEQNFCAQAKPGKYLSRYMLYILVMHPEMLPTGIGRIKFHETYMEAMKFFNGLKSVKADEDTDDEAPFDDQEGIRRYRKYVMKCAGFCASTWRHIRTRKKCKLDITSAFEQLQEQVNTKMNLMVARGEKSKYVLFHRCRLASQLRSEVHDGLLLEDVVSEMWVKILCDASDYVESELSYTATEERRAPDSCLAHDGPFWLDRSLPDSI